MTGASAQHGRVLPQHAQLPILQPCQVLCGQSIANSDSISNSTSKL